MEYLTKSKRKMCMMFIFILIDISYALKAKVFLIYNFHLFSSH